MKTERESLPVATSVEAIPSSSAYPSFRRQAVTNETSLPVDLEFIDTERIVTIDRIDFNPALNDG